MLKAKGVKKITLLCYGITTIIFLFIILQGINLSSGNEMGYCLLYFYIVMPLTSFILSLVISSKKGYLYQLYPIFVGMCGAMIPFIIFKTFDWIFFLLTFVPASIGLIIGLLSVLIKVNKSS